MFIGHFAPALAARAITDEAPKLGTLFIAAQLVDLAFFTFAMVGIEHLRMVPGITRMNALDLYFMPYTHSLVGTGVFAAAFALFLYFRRRNAVAATWVAIVVLSHWFLDLLVHRPDLTFAGGSDKFGLGLWNFPAIEIPLELGITGLAFWWYVRRTKGPLVPALALGLTMLGMQAFNWLMPQADTVDWTTFVLPLIAYALLIGLAFWVQSTRWHKQQVGLAVASVRR